MKNSIFVIVVLSIALLYSCDNKYEPKDPDDQETINSGKLTVYCDEAIDGVLDSAFQMYRKQYEQVILTDSSANSRNVMAQLLSKQARVIVNARDYLPDEIEKMNQFNVKPHQRFEVAYDALVFFVSNSFPIDTLNAAHIENAIANGGELSKSTNGLDFEPTYATVNQNSSIFANFNKYILKNRTLKKKLNLLDNIEEVKKQVEQNNSIIGIGYLSQLKDDKNFKMLRIGFDSDSLNRYITPKPVHQGYIVQDLYPYKVTYYAYLLEDRQNLPFWFATFLAKETKVQQYFLNEGIVPAFARIKLKYEE